MRVCVLCGVSRRVWRMCSGLAGAVRVPKSKNASPLAAGESGTPNARILRHESNKSLRGRPEDCLLVAFA